MSLNVFEIRNYLIQPAMRDHFIEYFEANFIFSQHEVGMHVLGQFRVIGHPDHYVWMRGFTDMNARLSGLSSFYNGPFWKKHRQTTNAMIIDSDHVHLLRPLGEGVDLTGGHTAQTIADQIAESTISIKTGVFSVDFYQSDPAELDEVAAQVLHAYRDSGIHIRAVLAAEMSQNDFPRLPAIQNPGEFVIISVYDSEAHYRQQSTGIAGLAHASKTEPSLLLAPTLRSPMRW